MDLTEATSQELFDTLLARLMPIQGYEPERIRYITLTPQPNGDWTKFRAAIKPPPEIEDGDGLATGTLWEPETLPNPLRAK